MPLPSWGSSFLLRGGVVESNRVGKVVSNIDTEKIRAKTGRRETWNREGGIEDRKALCRL
jgi:hypothetical protein